MTREEAIKLLQVTKLMLMDGANQPISDLYYALDMAIEALEQTENSSEKPNNYCDDCLYTDTCDSKEFFYACTSKATISKMEQVDKDINVRSKDEPQTDWETKKRDNSLCYKCVKECDRRVLNRYTIECNQYEPKDEPTISKMEQVEKPQTCDTCKYGEDKHRYAHICNECGVGINNYEPKDELQTEGASDE